MSVEWPIWTAVKERLFARRIVKRLLHSHATVRAARPELSGEALYREVLLHSREVDHSQVDTVMRGAWHSVDEWTAPGKEGLGLREVAHFVVMRQHQAKGNTGAVAPFRAIVSALIPAEL